MNPDGQQVPLLLKLSEAARLLSLGRTTVYAMVASGELPVVHIGRAVRIPAAALAVWVEAQSQREGALPGVGVRPERT
ncbi:MAG: helix-turn-helix domain-containing protein [Armatimonadetes bacterium]|nr:helix-turn-helix domain-containing protein [Armatimonadota bacterium]